MEWVWLITTAITICVLLILRRLVYRQGYKAGANRVLVEWKNTLEEEHKDESI